MNVMLVDADKDNLRNFKRFIKSRFPEIRVVGQFSAPQKDIIPVIEDLRPDLLLADVKFFGGARFMRFKDIHDKFPLVKFLVYGTFNETEYMRRARDFGVIEYMFRPVKTADLSRCLKLAIAQIKKLETERQGQTQQRERYKDDLSHYETIFLRTLAEGRITDIDEIKRGFAHFELELEPGYTAAIVHIDGYRKIIENYSESDKHLLIFRVYQIVTEETAGAITFMPSFHEVALFLGGYRSIEKTVSILNELKETLLIKIGARVSIGLGRTYDVISDIGVSYKEAVAAFKHKARMGSNAVLPIEFCEPNNRVTYRYPSEREDELVFKAVVGDYNYCHMALLEIFDALGQVGRLPEGLLPKILMSIVIKISRYVAEQNLPIGAHITRFFPTADFMKTEGLQEGFLIFDKALQSFCAFMRNYAEENNQKLYRAARQYIEHNFSDAFSTSKIAATLGATPEHLNRIFKDRERLNLYDYVMRKRMDQAKWMLRESELNEEEVCAKIGFSEVKYFRSLFKQYEGITPAEYRAREGEPPKPAQQNGEQNA